jgi:NADH-quinone oxidoreductase subunit L
VEGGALTPTLWIMAFIGTFTALFAALIALAQNDIKRVLAYSTISQLGFMVAALGIGAYVAAAFHLVTHAFFKGLLFLGSGSVIHGMEHGVLHTGKHIDPNNMFNMGGLKKHMPITFWTFLIGGFALAGFPLLTAGFWSKDEILADAFGHKHYLVFSVLAITALITAFYTMRQITLTFLGDHRTEEAKYAHESRWTMTLPLIFLAFFAVTFGWVGIPEHFPLLGNLAPGFFYPFVDSTLLESIKPVNFNVIPLLTSVVVALGGLSLGWVVYRNVPAGAPDPLQVAFGRIYTVLQNKFYFDELYDFLFVRPAYWISETLTYQFIDRGLIDGTLHTISRAAFSLGTIFRNWIDKPVINGFADKVGEGTKLLSDTLRYIQTGRVQQYLLMALVFTISALFYYLFIVIQP